MASRARQAALTIHKFTSHIRQAASVFIPPRRVRGQGAAPEPPLPPLAPPQAVNERGRRQQRRPGRQAVHHGQGGGGRPPVSGAAAAAVGAPIHTLSRLACQVSLLAAAVHPLRRRAGCFWRRRRKQRRRCGCDATAAASVALLLCTAPHHAACVLARVHPPRRRRLRLLRVHQSRGAARIAAPHHTLPAHQPATQLYSHRIAPAAALCACLPDGRALADAARTLARLPHEHRVAGALAVRRPGEGERVCVRDAFTASQNSMCTHHSWHLPSPLLQPGGHTGQRVTLVAASNSARAAFRLFTVSAASL